MIGCEVWNPIFLSTAWPASGLYCMVKMVRDALSLIMESDPPRTPCSQMTCGRAKLLAPQILMETKQC